MAWNNINCETRLRIIEAILAGERNPQALDPSPLSPECPVFLDKTCASVDGQSQVSTLMQPISSTTDPEENDPFRVEVADGEFRVVNMAGEVVLVCGNEANAIQYVALLSQAYRRGYKAGYRKARASI
jgi:hypothetical protein